MMTDSEAFKIETIGMCWPYRGPTILPTLPPGWTKADGRLLPLPQFERLRKATGAACMANKTLFRVPQLCPERIPADEVRAGDWLIRAMV